MSIREEVEAEEESDAEEDDEEDGFPECTVFGWAWHLEDELAVARSLDAGWEDCSLISAVDSDMSPDMSVSASKDVSSKGGDGEIG